MKLLTCTGCKSAGNCPRAIELRAKVKGLRLTTARFICPDRETVFQPGQAVIFTTFIHDEDDSYQGVRYEVDYRGHVVEQRGSKVIGFIVPGTPDLTTGIPFEARSGGYVKMPMARVRADVNRPAADPQRCSFCGNHPSFGASCAGDPEYVLASRCLATELAAGSPRNPNATWREHPELFHD